MHLKRWRASLRLHRLEIIDPRALKMPFGKKRMIMRKKLFLAILAFLFISSVVFAAKKPSIDRIDPPFWWVGMQNSTLELLIKGSNLEGVEQIVLTSDSADVQLKEFEAYPNPHYLRVVLEISPTAKAGTVTMEMTKEGKKYPIEYQLRKRHVKPEDMVGLNSSDFIYLVMPDRFANGDPSNDKVGGMNENKINRDSSKSRHGGDLQGIIDNLSYISSLGVTALWLNPVQENDEPKESYHGYAITDHYRIDPRLGDNELYRKLSEECKRLRIRLLMDVVYNHWGDQHYLHTDMPDPDWVHKWSSFTRTTYRAPTLMDPYAAESDREVFSNGWFDHHMPDLNQKSPHLATYLIQNSIWWIEYAALEGFRIDTYAYSDQEFMNELIAAILKEYPNFGLFGETWVHGNSVQGFFAENAGLHPQHKSLLPAVTDFQHYYAINEALSREQGWTEGAARLYFTLAKDFIYRNPNKNVIFLDNHDLSRFYSMVGENMNKFKMGVAWLMTMRGIPMLFYGSEILMTNFADPDSKVRTDFPGGWSKDKYNKFESGARTRRENQAFNYIRKLAKWRRNNEVIHNGGLTQFVPEKGLYVYFRYNEKKTVMVALNFSKEKNLLEVDRYHERLWAFTSGKDVITNQKVLLTEDLPLEPWTVLILEFEKP